MRGRQFKNEQLSLELERKLTELNIRAKTKELQYQEEDRPLERKSKELQVEGQGLENQDRSNKVRQSGIEADVAEATKGSAIEAGNMAPEKAQAEIDQSRAATSAANASTAHSRAATQGQLIENRGAEEALRAHGTASIAMMAPDVVDQETYDQFKQNFIMEHGPEAWDYFKLPQTFTPEVKKQLDFLTNSALRSARMQAYAKRGSMMGTAKPNMKYPTLQDWQRLGENALVQSGGYSTKDMGTNDSGAPNNQQLFSDARDVATIADDLAFKNMQDYQACGGQQPMASPQEILNQALTLHQQKHPTKAKEEKGVIGKAWDKLFGGSDDSKQPQQAQPQSKLPTYQEYDKLPSGAIYTDPNGAKRRKK
jgi:hypothetical protein